MSESNARASRPYDAPPRRPPLTTRMLSWAVAAYTRHSPVARGKWWLRKRTEPWLVARLDVGGYIRVSNVAEYEWTTFMGGESEEDATSVAFRSMVKPGHLVVDIGANVGYYTIMAALQVGPGGRVIAFEPGATTVQRLRENVALNGFPNVTVEQIAIADSIGTAKFKIGEDSELSSLYDVFPAEGHPTIDVPLITLDRYLADRGITEIDLLKIDAEGAEPAIIRGAVGLMKGPNPPPILLEANPLALKAAGSSVDALRQEIERVGYTITVVEQMPWLGVTVESWLAKRG